MSQQFSQQYESEEPLPLSNQGTVAYQDQLDAHSAQKLTSPGTPTAQQCQNMAIISMSVWILVLIFATGFATYTRFWSGTHYVMAFCLFLLMILLIAINSGFNRGRAADPSENPTTNQRMQVVLTSLIAWILILVSGIGFALSFAPWEGRDTVGLFALYGLTLFTFLAAAINLSFNRSRPAR